jgi:hypothetical protein
MLVAFFTSLGAKVVAAEDGRDAMARIEAAQADLVLLDVIMPYRDGLPGVRRRLVVGCMRANRAHTPSKFSQQPASYLPVRRLQTKPTLTIRFHPK